MYVYPEIDFIKLVNQFGILYNILSSDQKVISIFLSHFFNQY
jgi:hypothetical protein